MRAIHLKCSNIKKKPNHAQFSERHFNPLNFRDSNEILIRTFHYILNKSINIIMDQCFNQTK